MRVRLQVSGRACVLSDLVATGGEARVFAIPGDGSTVAKVYKAPTPDRARKLAVMLANPPEDPLAHQGRIAVAWPQDLLLDATGRVVGFTMPRVSGARPLVDLYNPATRRRVCPLFGYRYLVRTARNVAVAVGAVHARGHVVADLREANLLAADDTIVTLVDADSFQVQDPNTGLTYRCPVGTPEYTPPELHGRDFRTVDRTELSDRFGLAVVLFELLMEGVHPFDGRYTGSGDAPPREDRVRSGWFPHGAARGPFVPKPLAPPLALLPPDLAAMFVRCFEEGHRDPTRRPAAADWRDALIEAERGLVACASNGQHHHWPHARGCPWCARAAALGGRDPFPSQEDVRNGRHLKPRTAGVSQASRASGARPATQASWSSWASR